jgi:dTMP kinase
MKRGILVTLEGIDGCGKSSVLAHLENSLEGRIIFTSEPTKGWTGKVVKKSIQSNAEPLTETFLFVADHAYHVRYIIEPALDEGWTVISNRYSDSRYAYQGVLLKPFFKDAVKWLKDMHRGWTITPDKTFLLLVEPETAISRITTRKKTKFENAEFLARVQRNYLRLAGEEPGRFVKIDANAPLRNVKKDVEIKIKELISTHNKRYIHKN